MKFRFLFLQILLLALVVRINGVINQQRSSVVLEHSLQKVRPGAVYTTETENLVLYSAKNEYESFQIILNGPLEVDGVNIDEVFTGFPPLVHLQHYINLTIASDCLGETGLWPDALIPEIDVFDNQKRNVFPVSVADNDNKALWVDLFVPPNAKSGEYTITVNVVLSNKSSITKKLTLIVFNMVLPSASTFATEFGFSIYDALKAHKLDPLQSLALGQKYVDLALMHRITLGEAIHSDPVINTRNEIDWVKFNANWYDYFNGKKLPYGIDGAKLTSCQLPTSFCYNFSACDEATKQSQVSQWKDISKYFKTKGWFELLFDYTQDEPHLPSQWQQLKTRSQYVHQADPDLRVLCTTEMQTANENDAQSYIDLWVPIINFIEPKKGCWRFDGNFRSLYDNVKYLWWYQSCMSHGCGGRCDPKETCTMGWPDYMVDHTAVTNRIMSWMSYLYNMQGELYWSINWASGYQNPWTDIYFANGNGDGTMTYPGTPTAVGGTSNIPIASIRLKHIRDGLEDMEYFRLLEKKLGRSKVLPFLQTVVSNDYTFKNNATTLLETRKDIGSQF
eukprot:TRINITY_DN5980_c0_g1_i1.p1 TRINITY_DN5980_c0_g1~~TRINITY_DN5980_c0_g1_i1.p1  ORF type:complete len:562 (-),score=59.54 TRINITY_DN5980_c0_g1_i1:77-1762(-)